MLSGHIKRVLIMLALKILIEKIEGGWLDFNLCDSDARFDGYGR